MKSFNIRSFSKNLKKIHETMNKRKEPVLITKLGKVVGKFSPAEDTVLPTEIAQEEAVIKTVKIDTFNEVEVKETEHLMGICSRCGTNGEVVKAMYLNSNGVYDGKYLCVAKCHRPGIRHGVNPIIKSDKVEMTFNQAKKQSDFGGANEKRGF